MASVSGTSPMLKRGATVVLKMTKGAPDTLIKGASGILQAAQNASMQLGPMQQIASIKLFQEQIHEAKVFVSHTRTAANFVRGNTDKDLVIPPAYPPECSVHASSLFALYHVLFSTPAIRSAALDSLGASLLASALVSFVWLIQLLDGDTGAEVTAISVLELASRHVRSIVGSFRFFPSFLLLGLLSFTVDRWRKWLVNAHTVQARIHDIGTSVGGAVITSADPVTRQTLFVLYRYLNAIHALTYQSVHPKLPKQLEGFETLGLLTAAEVKQLKPMANKVRDTLIAWAAATTEKLVREGCVRELAIGNMMIAGLRGICARHHDLFMRNMPNVWMAMAKLLIDYLVYLHLISLALSSINLPRDDAASGTGVRNVAELILGSIATLMFGFLLASAYWLAWAITQILANPFKAGNDSFNSDALLGSTERQLFATLRSTFDFHPLHSVPVPREKAATSAGSGMATVLDETPEGGTLWQPRSAQHLRRGLSGGAPGGDQLGPRFTRDR